MTTTHRPVKKETIGRIANFMAEWLEVSDEFVYPFDGFILVARSGDTEADIIRRYQQASKKRRRRANSKKR